MPKFQFRIRTLLIATLLVAISLPTLMSHYTDIEAYVFPAPAPLPSAAEVIPVLMRRVPPCSCEEIVIRPSNSPIN